MSLAIRRLRYQDQDRMERLPTGRSATIAANPFDRLAQRVVAPGRLRVCLDTKSLAGATGDDAFVAREIAAHYRREALEVFRTPGDPPANWGKVPQLEVNERIENNIAGVRLAMDGEEVRTGSIWAIDQFRRLGRDRFGPDGFQHLLEIGAGGSLDPDLIVTAEPAFLRWRHDWPFSRYNVVSPAEAYPIVGIWSRALGQNYLSGWVRLDGFYPLILVRALTPADWSGYAALNSGQRIVPNGRELFALANSIHHRLMRLVVSLENLALAWQRRRARGLLADLDAIILGVWAIQDNLALLVGKFYEIDLKSPLQWSLLRPKWQHAVASRGAKALRLVEFVRSAEPALLLSQELRHHVVHRQLLPSMVTSSTEGEIEQLEVQAEVLERLKDSLTRMNERAGDWGIGPERPAETVQVRVRDEDGQAYYDELIEAHALLDPMPFAARLVAQVLGFTERILRLLDAASDPRLPEKLRLRAQRFTLARPNDPAWHIYTLENRRAAVLSSPLAGLVETPTE